MPLVAKQFDQPLNSWSWNFPHEVSQRLNEQAHKMVGDGQFEIFAEHLEDCGIRLRVEPTPIDVLHPSHDDRDGCALAVASALNEFATS